MCLSVLAVHDFPVCVNEGSECTASDTAQRKEGRERGSESAQDTTDGMSSKKKTVSDHDADLASQLQAEELQSIGAKPLKTSAGSPAVSTAAASSSSSSSAPPGTGGAPGPLQDIVHKSVLARIEPEDLFAVDS